MTTWARAGLDTYLRHDFAVFPGSDHWAQVDVWIPQLDPCPNPNAPGVAFLPYFLRLGAFNALAAASTSSPVPNWHWASFSNHQASPGPAAGTTYTVGYHVHGSTFDWYIDGVLVLSEPLSGFGAFNFLTLNYSAPACCCQAVYYTNVLVGTAQGAGDLFADDFSGGNFNNWYTVANQTSHPVVASLVGAPTANPCPTLSVSPTRGQPGSTMHVTGSGFTPGPVTVWWDSQSGSAVPVENVSPVADGSGNLAFDMEVPQGVGSDGTTGPVATPRPFYVIDSAKLVGCANFAVCSANNSDGIRADVDGDGFSTYTPDPLVALGGTQGSEGSGTGLSPTILDYIFHDGSHWVLWTDPSVSSRSVNTTTFPPPTNHTLNATRISADGSSIEDFPMDTNYAWLFGAGHNNDPGLFDTWPVCGQAAPVWSRVSYFSSWQKPVYDARFASDGDTLWVGLVTAESVPYPWIDDRDAHGHNPGGVTQAAPLALLTAGFTHFATDADTGYLRYYNNPTGAIDFFHATAFPLTDAGINGMGVWNPPVVVMFAFSDGTGFDRIGEVAAKYCPSVIQQTDGYQNQGGSIIGGILAVNTAPNGSLFGRVALAASQNNPGVCHVVWSEGGDWGRVSDGFSCTTGQFGGSRITWDAGPANRSYRVNHTTWSPTAKLTDTDIFESHIDRTNWWFTYSYGGFFNNLRNGYTWPVPGEFAGLLTYDLRCDNANGDVLLFVSKTIPFQGIQPPNGNPDPDGHPWLDNLLLFDDTLYVYEISGGTAVLRQSIDGSLLPSAVECGAAYPLDPRQNLADATPVDTTSDCLLAVAPAFDPFNGKPLRGVGPQDKAFGISDIYEDPLLDGLPVYLVHVPWARRFPDRINGGYGNYPMRGFYRVPADMSGPFEFLDGERQAGFTVLGGALSPTLNAFGGGDTFGSGDFFSDPHNIWCPTPGGPAFPESGSVGLWFDRVCKNQWKLITQAETPGDFIGDSRLFVGYNTCPGFHYDPDADSITLAAPPKNASYPAAFAVERLFICRGCSQCRCGRGIHIAHRF